MVSNISGSNKTGDAEVIKKFLQYLISLAFTVALTFRNWGRGGGTLLRKYKRCYSVFEP